MKLELRGITKRFGALVANDHINLTVEPGEIHCLLGENGAGKSTLMNVLYGLYTADEGEVLLDGEVQHFRGPGDAMAAGIGMVHQHFMLIPVFTVAENVMLGNETTLSGGRLDIQAAREKVRAIADRFGFHVDPDALIEDLPVGVQQRVEIIKALSRDAKVLIFDEPTAVLTPQETDEFMGIMRQLRDEGAAIVFITHKLREVREVADRITVVRRGAVVGEATADQPDSELAAMMVGRAVELTVHKDEPRYAETSLEVSGLEVTNAQGAVVVDDVSFTVRGGEILVIAGVQGNGQTELTEALVGLEHASAGSVRLAGKELVGRSVNQVLDAGVGFIPEDRSTDGLVGEFTVAENLMLDRRQGPPFVRAGMLQLGARDDFARNAVEEFDIRTQGITEPVARLSGGNQQKVVVARELSRELRLLVAAQPTRGVDVGSIEFIHKRIVATRDAGVPVVVISTELDEAVALGDRILVMYRGRVVGIVPADTPRDVLGLMMAGIAPEGSAAA
ncbi:ABC transporter ATP-binding protein [Isoptericola sp. b441]|uniref:ABC transporter ATP-binding protein n=1 Tax=Actinotalea lenta TaxID=3064654 RepID=A0ABT9D7S3_9CELL|nr:MULTISPECIES: ABC transporter ATP-binding protein [unclassified Isoptericola]MDO8106906.1 ABC transporter ATP-binding protein [Isoptericola sp. b441]MDO8121383.1 ABC transporter ATP-binding protein [Isoptericola sp. b490]